MRRRVGIYGVSDETLRLVGLLIGNPDVEVVRLYDRDPEGAARRADEIGRELGDFVRLVMSSDLDTFVAGDDLHAVIDAGGDTQLPAFTSVLPNATERGIQVVTPLAARLLWAYGVAARERKNELLQALAEVVESVELTIDSDELFTRMLEIAIGVTGAEGGSLMLLDEGARELAIRVAIGVEKELWAKIRVPLGEGLAGRAAADGDSLLIAGKADQHAFQIVRERLDVESALCVPLKSHGRVLGVLNLHHSTRSGAFTVEDLAFVEQLAHLDAQIIARAQEHESLRDQAAHYATVREVRTLLSSLDPLPARLRGVCQLAARKAGHGIANLFLRDGDDRELRLYATSLEGGGFGGEYRVVFGQGIDGRVAETGEARFLHGDDDRLEYAAMPLRSGSETLGVLAVQAGTQEPRHTGTAVGDTLLEIARALGEGLAQHEREGRMTTRATRLSALNETGIRMLSAQSATEVVKLATSSIAMILEAEHAVLRLQDEESRRYVIRSYFGPADGPQQERIFRLDKRCAKRTLERRGGWLIRDTDVDEGLAGGEEVPCRSLLSTPLKRDGLVIGTLSCYDKIASDRFYPSRFDDEDLQVFAKFASYVERAVANAEERTHTRRHRHFDLETGLPNESHLAQRLAEEIARAGERPGALCLCVCSVENHDELAQQVGPAHAVQVVQRVADALRRSVRDFDVVARSGKAELTVLMPEPGEAPGERVYQLARSVADAIAKDEALNRPVRVALGFGYAGHPEDAAEAEALRAAARPPRIRRV